MISLHKYVVASSADAALLHAGVWQRHVEARGPNASVFNDANAARRTAQGRIRKAEKESPFGCKVPCDEHSRCVGFHPQVWDVRITVTCKEDA